MDRSILVVLSNPVEGKEEEYNEWYTNTHLKDVLSIPGFVAAQRFKLDEKNLATDTPYRYMAIYEIESEDIKSTMAVIGFCFFIVSTFVIRTSSDSGVHTIQIRKIPSVWLTSDLSV